MSASQRASMRVVSRWCSGARGLPTWDRTIGRGMWVVMKLPLVRPASAVIAVTMPTMASSSPVRGAAHSLPIVNRDRSSGGSAMLTTAMQRFPRLELVPAATPLEHLDRLSQHMHCDLWVQRDDLPPLALGGNKARKLEYLAADALRAGADCLVTAGAIQSNHVRQTAALAARLGLDCHALLENPIQSSQDCYLHNGN